MVRKGKGPAYRKKHAYILLNSDINKPKKSDQEIADYIHCHLQTVNNIHKRFVEEGLEAALERKQRETPPTPNILDGENEAKLIILACSKPPDGRGCWTLRLLSDKLIELEIVDTISPNTVGRALKKRVKTASSKMWVIPPTQSDEFVAHMEDILELYRRPYSSYIPLICMGEQPIQLIKEVRTPLPAGQNHVEKYDYEYQRNGTANVLMFTEPLKG